MLRSVSLKLEKNFPLLIFFRELTCSWCRRHLVATDETRRVHSGHMRRASWDATSAEICLRLAAVASAQMDRSQRSERRPSA